MTKYENLRIEEDDDDETKDKVQEAVEHAEERLEDYSPGFNIEDEVKESDQTREEMFTTANHAYEMLRETWIEVGEPLDRDNYTFADEPFDGVRGNGMLYLNQEEIGSLAHVMANAAETIQQRESRIKSLEEHRNYNQDVIEALKEDNKELRSENERLRNRSMLQIIRERVGL